MEEIIRILVFSGVGFIFGWSLALIVNRIQKDFNKRQEQERLKRYEALSEEEKLATDMLMQLKEDIKEYIKDLREVIKGN